MLASKLRGNILFCFRDYVRQIIQNEAKSYTFGSDYVSTKYATMYVYIILSIQIKFLIWEVRKLCLIVRKTGVEVEFTSSLSVK
jgi:hypothetical protein